MTKNTGKTTKSSAIQLSLDKLLDDYHLSLETMNRSPKTISWYLEILRRYFAYLASNLMLKPLRQLGRPELKSYILHLQQASRWANSPNIKKAAGRLSPYSVQGHVRAIKAFWSWLEAEGYVDENCLAKLPLPKVPQKPVRVLSREEAKRLLSQIDRCTLIGAKYYAIMLLLLDTGIRISELASIRIEDLNLQHDCVQVLGKGQKVRSVPMSTLTRKEINRYINRFRPQLCQSDSPYLFARSEGKHISVNSVQQFLRRLANRAGLIGAKCSPHVLRHTFATQSIANGANVFVLKDIMGHASLSTTMKYTHLQPQDLQNQHKRFSPVTNLGIDKTS